MNRVANAPYAMAKAGVETFGRALRAELAGTGATAGVRYPGSVSTPIAHGALGGHATAAQLVRRAFPGPLRRPITPEAVIQATLRGLRAAHHGAAIRWLPISLLRGMFNPLSDWLLDRHRPIQRLIRQVEQPGR